MQMEESLERKSADNDEVVIQEPLTEIKISVRRLVEFILRRGNIDNRHKGSPDNAMQEGSRIHRMIQRKMGSEYQAEVFLRYTLPAKRYHLMVEGRADGIIDTRKCVEQMDDDGGITATEGSGEIADTEGSGETADTEGSRGITATEGSGEFTEAEGGRETTVSEAIREAEVTESAGDKKEQEISLEEEYVQQSIFGTKASGSGEIVIDEIKGTYRDLGKMKEPVPEHLAQAKCYAFMYGAQHFAREVRVRMTYCNLETEEIRYFYEDYTMEELSEWFETLIAAYRKWADYECEWRQIRKRSIEEMSFPFPYREGQKELASYVYQTIFHKKKLFLEAPTGVGKTISTMFPSIKAMGKGMADRIFYLTAKTITRTVADSTLSLLRGRGLHLKSVILTAKDKICFMEETQCNPECCPYAKGHYDRINDAVFDLLTQEESFSRENLEEYSRKHHVCPFEMGLDMSLFSDCIIGDYNYLFDPHVYLKRFFAQGCSNHYIFLIDEAHNLLERGREMYSGALLKEDFLELKHQIQQTAKGEEAGSSILIRQGFASKLEKQLEKCNKELLLLKRESGEFRIESEIDGFVQALLRLHTTIDNYLDEQEEGTLPVRERILDFYFDICHFLDIYERVDENYVKYTQLLDNGDFLLKLFCVNPSVNLGECMMRGKSSILFSATFLPIQYYKGLLGGEAEDYEVYAQSVFQPEKRGLYIASDVTSKYTRRSDQEFLNITRYIHEIVKNRHGNYMIFFPSYSFLQTVYGKYAECFQDEFTECLIQTEYMNERDREDFLSRFEGIGKLQLQDKVRMEIEEEDSTLIGFCVMGGIFSEGIDLKNDSLIGVIIVGTGLPQICLEREILKNYFDSHKENGFDYSYRYPGMNKVLQSAGRVIRTLDDVGIIVLLDERFQQYSYQKLFPREWEDFEVVTCDTVAKKVERFWDSWL